MSSDLQPLLECGLVSWAGGRGVIHPTPPPSNPSSHQLHFERHPWPRVPRAPPTICWRDMLDHGSWTNFNIRKKKNNWLDQNHLQSTSNLHPFRELLLSFFKLKLSMCRMPVGDPTSLIAREAGFVFRVQTCSSKIPYPPEIATVTIMWVILSPNEG